MGRRRTGRGLLVGACLLVFLSAGCTPDDPPPAPPSTTVPPPTPTENAQEREERLAYEAAEKSYREFRAEYNRVLATGGAARSTNKMLRNAGGPYLAELQAGAEAYRGLRRYARGNEVIVYLRPDGYSPNEVLMQICEDSRGVTTYDAKGKKLYTGDLRELSLVFRLKESRWKAWTGSGKKVADCA